MPWSTKPYRHYHSWLVHAWPSLLCHIHRNWRR